VIASAPKTGVTVDLPSIYRRSTVEDLVVFVAGCVHHESHVLVHIWLAGVLPHALCALRHALAFDFAHALLESQ